MAGYSNMQNLIARIHTCGVIPVVAVEDADQALPLGEALLKGGLPCAELTFRTNAAPAAIRKMCRAYPEMLVGAGTVLTVEQAEQAAEAGARYFLAPGLDPEIVEWCRVHEMLFMPGVMTPSDISLAVKAGLRLLKFFPAVAAGGPAALKSISDPFIGVDFVPTGGIHAGNLAEFLSMPMVRACGGSWLAGRQLIAAGDFEEVTRRTAEAVGIVEKVRAGAA